MPHNCFFPSLFKMRSCKVFPWYSILYHYIPLPSFDVLIFNHPALEGWGTSESLTLWPTPVSGCYNFLNFKLFPWDFLLVGENFIPSDRWPERCGRLLIKEIAELWKLRSRITVWKSSEANTKSKGWVIETAKSIIWKGKPTVIYCWAFAVLITYFFWKRSADFDEDPPRKERAQK